MPERISDGWVRVISFDVASRAMAGSWNEPVSRRLVFWPWQAPGKVGLIRLAGYQTRSSWWFI